jgi:Ca2+/Na+ antiporter
MIIFLLCYVIFLILIFCIVKSGKDAEDNFKERKDDNNG